ncbi:uncharacterized protein LOC110037141 [Phalaenopsis equestris]|uniref:uncharacterized protein LOC110037141 n=1 Tax=Phalaenopsis equestris TaxID=78828 RepID=UPI0009E3F9F8|nr:uncharacterized protein LOC110037141 [Phalaenopsis equestris]
MSLPFIVVWFLWNARNKAKHEDIGTNPDSVVRWENPPYPFIKINTDGSFTNKKAAIGGIFRDHTDKVLLYFKAPYIVFDDLETKAIVIYWALKFAMEIQWNWIIAEVDSSLLVDLITENFSPPWHIIQWMHKIKKLIIDIKLQISFVFREANMPANFLALEGPNSIHAKVSTSPPLPLQLLLQRDKLHIPYLRLQT